MLNVASVPNVFPGTKHADGTHSDANDASRCVAKERRILAPHTVKIHLQFYEKCCRYHNAKDFGVFSQTVLAETTALATVWDTVQRPPCPYSVNYGESPVKSDGYCSVILRSFVLLSVCTVLACSIFSVLVCKRRF